MQEAGRYLYCICRADAGEDLGKIGISEDPGEIGIGGGPAEAGIRKDLGQIGNREDLGKIGIEDSSVYVLPFRGMAAVVHACEARPYDTSDGERARQWVFEHAFVIDQAMKRYGTVLPFSFDVIIKGGDGAVTSWMEENHEAIAKFLRDLDGKAEYSVQVFYDYDLMAEEATRGNPEICLLRSLVEGESPGRAFLLKRNLDMKIRDAVSARAESLSEEMGSRIVEIATRLIIDGGRPPVPEKYREMKLLASFSCLLTEKDAEALGGYLDEVNSMNGIAVRFTGPWAPFSFVESL